ncbi:MAG: condensation domain-containing protein [Coriobacteriales bacterium]|nr:condensation domain-containing protein [Coriobacteriales bacterium]
MTITQTDEHKGSTDCANHAATAELIDHTGFMVDNKGNSIFQVPFQARYPVQGLVIFGKGRTGRPFYGGLGGGLLVEGDLDLCLVEEAVQRLFDDIDSTRIMFPASPDLPIHYRIRDHVSFKLEVFPIYEGSFKERVAAAAASEYPHLSTLKTYVDVALRVVVYDLGIAPSGKHGWVIAFSASHVAVDDQGIFLVIDQFMANYRGENRMVVHQHSLLDCLNYMNDNPDCDDPEANRAYWRREMQGFVTPSLHESNPDRTTPIDPADLKFMLDTEQVKRLALACQTTLPSLFMAALHIGIAAGFNLRDSAICMLTEARPNYIFWNTVVHGLMSMNHRMQIEDSESFLEFARRTVLKMSSNLQNLASEEYVGGAAPVYYTYVSPVKSPNLGEGLDCKTWMPDLIGDDAGYLPWPEVAIVEGADTMEFMLLVLDQSICFFTPNEARAFAYGVRRCLELAIENPGVLVADIVEKVQTELRAKGVITEF